MGFSHDYAKTHENKINNTKCSDNVAVRNNRY